MSRLDKTHDPTELDVALCEMARVGIDPDLERWSWRGGVEFLYTTTDAVGDDLSLMWGMVDGSVVNAASAYLPCGSDAAFAEGRRFAQVLREAGL